LVFEMRALVTGGTGFIGSHLVERLVKEGWKVNVLVRKSPSNLNPEPRNNARDLLRKLKVDIFYGDLLDEDSLEKAMKDVRVVFHLAAIARPMAIPDRLYLNVNEKGTKNLMEVCKKKSLKKIIVMSSVSAVGPSRDGNPVDEKTKCRPIDKYGESKLAAEKVVMDYFKKYELPIVILRPPMVFGPRDFEMLKLFKAVSKRFFPIKGSKNGLTEFLYVENLVEACILAVDGKIGEIYHVTNGRSYTIDDIINAIAKAENVKMRNIKFPGWSFILVGYVMEFLGKLFRFHPPFKHDTIKWMTTKFWYSNPNKIKRELKYVPKFSLEDGARKTFEYYKERELI
jgi:nucleoside-diphosphate-sugar epimerase